MRERTLDNFYTASLFPRTEGQCVTEGERCASFCGMSSAPSIVSIPKSNTLHSHAQTFGDRGGNKTTNDYIDRIKRVKYRAQHAHHMRPCKIHHGKKHEICDDDDDEIVHPLRKSPIQVIDHEARIRSDSTASFNRFVNALHNKKSTSPGMKNRVLFESGSHQSNPLNTGEFTKPNIVKPKKPLIARKRDITVQQFQESYSTPAPKPTEDGRPGYQLFPLNKKFDLEEYKQRYFREEEDLSAANYTAFHRFHPDPAPFKKGGTIVKVMLNRDGVHDRFDYSPYERMYKEKMLQERRKYSFNSRSAFRKKLEKTPTFSHLKKGIAKSVSELVDTEGTKGTLEKSAPAVVQSNDKALGPSRDLMTSMISSTADGEALKDSRRQSAETTTVISESNMSLTEKV